jgi:hypothetical protein
MYWASVYQVSGSSTQPSCSMPTVGELKQASCQATSESSTIWVTSPSEDRTT